MERIKWDWGVVVVLMSMMMMAGEATPSHRMLLSEAFSSLPHSIFLLAVHVQDYTLVSAVDKSGSL